MLIGSTPLAVRILPNDNSPNEYRVDARLSVPLRVREIEDTLESWRALDRDAEVLVYALAAQNCDRRSDIVE